MSKIEFSALEPGVLIASSGNPGRVYLVVRKTRYGWQVRDTQSGKLGKAINAEWWTRLRGAR
jgi:hypothetical protein